MPKQGMKRPEPGGPRETQSERGQRFNRNIDEPVPEIQGKAKTGNRKCPPKIG